MEIVQINDTPSAFSSSLLLILLDFPKGLYVLRLHLAMCESIARLGTFFLEKLEWKQNAECYCY